MPGHCIPLCPRYWLSCWLTSMTLALVAHGQCHSRKFFSPLKQGLQKWRDQPYSATCSTVVVIPYPTAPRFSALPSFLPTSWDHFLKPSSHKTRPFQLFQRYCELCRFLSHTSSLRASQILSPLILFFTCLRLIKNRFAYIVISNCWGRNCCMHLQCKFNKRWFPSHRACFSHLFPQGPLTPHYYCLIVLLPLSY